MKIDTLPDGYVKITPDEGKTLLCKLTNETHSEAIVEKNEVKRFREISID